MSLKSENVLFIVRTMGLGGTENVVLQLCEILNGRANKIIVCSSGGVHEKVLKDMGITHYMIPDISSKRIDDMFKIYFKLKKIIKEENITVIHSHHRMAAFYAELIAKDSVKKIATAHNTFENKKKLTHFAYKNTNLVAVGEMVKKNLTDYFEIPNKQVTVIHNAIKPYNGKSHIIEQLEKDRLNGYTLVGNIGRLSEQKGMVYFIEAAQKSLKKYPNTKFYIVGDGELKAELIQKVKDMHLENYIVFLGYRSDIQNIMSQLDFVVLSSLWEGFPLTPIEAFSVGKTVVGTAVDGTQEIIINRVNGLLVKAKDIIELSEAINLLIENIEFRNLLQKNAKQSYLEEFSFEKLSKQYIDYYEGL